MFQKKKLWTMLISIFACLAFAGCSSSQDSRQKLVSHADNAVAQPIKEDELSKGEQITEQTFDVALRPFGEVTFASYEPDTSDNPLADAVFLIERDGEVLTQLPKTGKNELFNQVEAVSFTDYNNDSYDDIILILSYYLGAGPQAAQPHSVICYYSGTAEGDFIYEEQMSQDATTALSEHTIQTAKAFINGEKAEPSANHLDAWQQAYLQYLSNDSEVEAQQGYTLINMSDDKIPQIVEVGDCEATGCRIIHYAYGKVHVTQLNRLYFSYIPGGNLLCNSEGLMDCYYDLVYCLSDGELMLIASGYYGAEDNSNVQLDENGEPIYQYEWNGIQISKEEYQEELSKVYDQSKATSYDYNHLYTLEKIIEEIQNYQS